MNPNFAPESFTQQEGMGEVPAFIRVGTIPIHVVTGVPSAALGADGDFALRTDGAAGANTCIYHHEGGAWVGLTA